MARSKNQNQRTRSYDEEEEERGACQWCEYGLVVVLATVLLIGVTALTIFWVMYYREGFAWNDQPTRQFNLHPTLMIAGFITFSGFSILLYRLCRCVRRIYVKLLHAIFHAMAFPCIVIGFIATWDSHNLATPPVPHFYSLHSWLGLVTMGLFALQYICAFFSFLLLLICNKATAGFRASMVPIHAAFGVLAFVLAVCCCLTGLTEKAFFTLRTRYTAKPDEGIIVNVLGMMLLLILALVMFIITPKNYTSTEGVRTIRHRSRVTADL